MKKSILLVIFFMAMIPMTFAQVNWEMDAMHTNVRFEVKHNAISIVDGEFTKVEGVVTSKKDDDFDGANFNYTIDVNSIDTRVKARNNHLLSKDFFYAEKYPAITLKNAKLHKKRDGKYLLKGDLTMKDVTKPVVFQVKYNGQFTDDKGYTHAGFTAQTTIDRTDFNINYDGKTPLGKLAVGKDIKIVVNTEVIKS